jgi:acetylornithine deacetylase
VARAIEEHTGEPPRNVGAVLPRSYAGNDTCHLWKAGIPCVLNGPDGGRSLDGEADTFVNVDEMVECAKTHALTALEVCNLPA